MVGLITNSPRQQQTETDNDTEWPKVDVGNLIIDLDADIKADTMMNTKEKSPSPAPHMPVGPAPTRPMTNGGPVTKPCPPPAAYPAQGPPPTTNGVAAAACEADSDKSLKMKIKRTKSGRQEIVKTEGGQGVVSSNGDSSDNVGGVSTPPDSPPSPPSVNGDTPHDQINHKVDAGTITDASTLTEPENLGPCEPGTSVNLEGIVWHETDTGTDGDQAVVTSNKNGVLVVNITWRGKTYVGTLLDCARHTNQWSAPRFTDSPEPGAKGRAKRNRSSLTPAELEPRKNLRSSKAKGKGKNGKGGDEFNFPAPSSPAKDGGKRKGRPEDCDDSKKRKRTGSESDDNCGDVDQDDTSDEFSAPSVLPKREPKPVVYSYKMLECPRRDCSKQYKHDEGLRWHLSHSHPEFIDANGDIKDVATVEREEQERRRKARVAKEERKRESKETDLAKSQPPSKVAKLDQEGKARDGSGSPKPGSKPVTSNGTPGPGQAPPRLPGQLPAGLIAPRPGKEPEAAAARVPALDSDKPPANSPAYSDISDDGEAPAVVSSAAPAVSAAKLPPKTVSSSLTTLGTSEPVSRSSSVPPPPSTTPSSLSRQSPRPPAVFSSPSVGPNPGTPEYHKYLAANGFPPFPYPYPVGMDPNYHVQLLKTDPIYKAKWEKDRAERERAFKEELDKDQGRYSGLALLKDDVNKIGVGNVGGGPSLPSTPVRRPESAHRLPEDLRKREPSGDRAKTAPSPVISVKAEFRERDEVKKEVKMEEGVKPTMETRGPPPGPQTFGYMHPGLIRPPYSLPGLPPGFADPILSSSLPPFGLPGGHNPYLRPPAGFSFPGDPLRSPFPSLPSPEDLARAGLPGAGPPGLSGTKALDLLQQHASQYYANQKLAELQERALKSPSLSSSSSSMAVSPAVSKSITTIAGKESPVSTSSSSDPKSKSPPPLRHVHTHTHTHIGLGYPLLPPVPGALPPVPGALPPGALPPPGVVPASFTGPYPGKSP